MPVHDTEKATLNYINRTAPAVARPAWRETPFMCSRRRSRMATFLLLWLVVISLASRCSQHGQSQVPAESHTIQFVHLAYEGGPTDEYRRLAAEFNAKHAQVVVEVQGYNDMAALQSAIESGADLIFAPSSYVDPGDLRPLDSMFESMPGAFRGDVPSQILDGGREGGHLMYFPASIGLYVIFYNQDLFDQAGLPYPKADWTWRDFVATAQALTASLPDGKKQYGFVPSFPGSLSGLLVVQQIGADWFISPDFRLDSEPVVEIMRQYTDLALAKGAMPTWQKYHSLQRVYGDLIAGGQVAMWDGWMDANAGRYRDETRKFKVGVAPIPHGLYQHTFFGLFAYMIPRSAQYPADAWEWLTFLHDNAASLFDKQWGVPASNTFLKSEAFQKYYGKQQVEAFQEILASSKLYVATPLVQQRWMALSNAELTAFSGAKSVEEALSEAQESLASTQP